MNKAALLFPGERLPYHVVDYALDWATENEGALQVIFFLPHAVTDEGYGFPNDLDQAEMLKTTFDAEEGIQKILREEIRYIEKRAKARHIPVTTEVLYSPSLDELTTSVKDAEILFIDKNIDPDSQLFEGLSFSVEELNDQLERLFQVGEFDRYSDVVY